MSRDSHSSSVSDKLTVIRESLANACKIAAMEFVKLPEVTPEAEDAIMHVMRQAARQSTDAPKLYWAAEEKLKTEFPARLQSRMAMACEMLLNRAQRKLMPLTAAQMELLADDELDRRLAVTDFSRRLSVVNDAAIDMINYRIKRFLRSASLGTVEINAPENPFGPSLMLDTLARFWDECAAPLGGSPTLLRHYGESLIPNLQSCYAKLNAYLESVHPLEQVAAPAPGYGSVGLGVLAPVEVAVPPPPPPPPPADTLASLTSTPDPELQRAVIPRLRWRWTMRQLQRLRQPRHRQCRLELQQRLRCLRRKSPVGVAPVRSGSCCARAPVRPGSPKTTPMCCSCSPTISSC